MESVWPAYTRKVLSLTASPTPEMLGIDMALASQLELDKEPKLQMEALRQIFKLHPVNVYTVDAMKQFLALMEPADPDRGAVAEPTGEVSGMDGAGRDGP